MSHNDNDTEIIPGDLVVILSSADSTPMDVPPGLVLEVRHGRPSTGSPDEKKTQVCSLLWKGFIDRWVDLKWLHLLSRGS